MGEPTPRADEILLNVHVREALTAGEPVRRGLICVGIPLPADPVETALAMELDAAQIADLLWETLPGGTLDMLVAELMGRRASVLRVGLLSVDEIARLQRERAQPPDVWPDGVPRRRCGAICSHGRQCDGTEPRDWHDHRHGHTGLLDCTWTEVSGGHGEATTGVSGDAGTPASAETTGEQVG